MLPEPDSVARTPAHEGTTLLLCHTPLPEHNSAVPTNPFWQQRNGLLSVQEANGKASRHAAGKGKNPAKQHLGFRTESLQSNPSGLIGTGRKSSGERLLSAEASRVLHVRVEQTSDVLVLEN